MTATNLVNFMFPLRLFGRSAAAVIGVIALTSPLQLQLAVGAAVVLTTNGGNTASETQPRSKHEESTGIEPSESSDVNGTGSGETTDTETYETKGADSDSNIGSVGLVISVSIPAVDDVLRILGEASPDEALHDGETGGDGEVEEAGVSRTGSADGWFSGKKLNFLTLEKIQNQLLSDITFFIYYRVPLCLTSDF